MKIVVDIPDNYDLSKIQNGSIASKILLDCIKNGTLLPKGHGDLISRQAAIDAFERFIYELGIKDEPYNYGEMALSFQNVPSVIPTRKKGKWVYHLRDSENDEYECFCCGQLSGYEYKYCPNCGTRMEV